MSPLHRLWNARILGSRAVLVVLVLAAVVVGVVKALHTSPAAEESQRVDDDLAALSAAVREFQRTRGTFPKELAELTRPGPRGEAPVLRDVKRDPWGGDYALHALGKSKFVVASSGADRQYGTEDDVQVEGRLP